MKRFFIVFAMLLCVMSVIGGHYYYNKKLDQTALAAKLELNGKVATVEEDESPAKKDKGELAALSKAPKEVQQLYQQRKKNGESLTLHLIGSKATSTEEGTWAALFKAKMDEVYGQDVQVEITSFDELTSLEIRNDTRYKAFLEKKSDVVLIEPFLMNDNTGVRVEDTLYVLNQMVDEIKQSNDQSVVLVQPSNPIFQPQKYADQVNGLKNYAAQQGITYLDHWGNWPSIDSEDIKNLYDEETYLPTQEGHKIWADYIFSQFK